MTRDQRELKTKFVNHFWVEVVNEEFGLKLAPMNGTKAFQKIRPSKIGLALTQDLVVMGKLVKGKRSGLKNTEKSFNVNIAEDRIVAVSIKVGPKILEQFLFQGMTGFVLTSKKMVMIFIKTTSWAISTSKRMPIVHNMANRKKMTSPLQKEGGMVIVLVADHGVDRPIDVTGE